MTYEGTGYLVTARHVAEALGKFPFCLRINRPGGGASFEFKDDVQWHYLADETVDVAVIEFNPKGQERLQKRFIDSSLLLSDARIKELDIQPGCICYVVGLFKFLQGKNKNMPLVYTGNVARLELGERVPVSNKASNKIDLCEVYLIEAHGIDGLSGSPVFVRQTRSLTYGTVDGGRETVLVPSNNLDLLGLFQGAWFLPPDASVAATYSMRDGAIVPVGLGMVVPASKIVELLEMPELKARREAAQRDGIAQQTSVAAKPEPPTTEGDEQHKERFTALLDAAARKPPQGG